MDVKISFPDVDGFARRRSVEIQVRNHDSRHVFAEKRNMLTLSGIPGRRIVENEFGLGHEGQALHGLDESRHGLADRGSGTRGVRGSGWER